ncbi:hypothetical protein BKA62DRAFT_679935 [Auriculariales sp. MPI-PUGE-AT-0066]|nr:hypothetical protein BKA62DRAFT_679935 [Auriculariales sp. MPI-PUGE-AT-0066]
MSQTAPINLRLSNGILTGHSDVEGYKYSVALTFASQPPPFTVDVGTLAYDDRNTQLIGSQPYTGTVGPASLVINFDDGATITAPLVDHISGAHDLAGTGSWSKECCRLHPRSSVVLGGFSTNIRTASKDNQLDIGNRAVRAALSAYQSDRYLGYCARPALVRTTARCQISKVQHLFKLGHLGLDSLAMQLRYYECRWMASATLSRPGDGGVHACRDTANVFGVIVLVIAWIAALV